MTNDTLLDLFASPPDELVDAIYLASGSNECNRPPLALAVEIAADYLGIPKHEADVRILNSVRDGLIIASLNAESQWTVWLHERDRVHVAARYGYGRLQTFIERGPSAIGRAVLRSAGSADRALDLFEAENNRWGLGRQFIELLEVTAADALACVYFQADEYSEVWAGDHEALHHAFMLRKLLHLEGHPYPRTREDVTL